MSEVEVFNVNLIGDQKCIQQCKIMIPKNKDEDTFSSILYNLQQFYTNIEQMKQQFCFLVVIEDGAYLNITQIYELVSTLSQYRHLTQEYSIGTCIVGNKNINTLLNLVFSLYKPVKHVEVLDNIKHGIKYCEKIANKSMKS